MPKPFIDSHLLGSAGWRALVVLVAASAVWISAPNFLPAQEPERVISGIVWELREGGGFRLKDGETVFLKPGARIRSKGKVFNGPLQIGWRVKVRGSWNSSSRRMLAISLDVLNPGPSGRVEGEALVEEVFRRGGSTIVLADGRELRFSEAPLRQRAEGTETGEAARAEPLGAGDYIRYTGRWIKGEWVEVNRFVARRNDLESGEAELHAVFAPRVHLPVEGDDDRAILQSGSRRFRLVNNQRLQLYIHRLGIRLLRNGSSSESGDSAGQETGMRFLVSENSQPQAMAFPGGTVVVNSGLFTFAENEAQFAFVIGHEIAHIAEEHAWRERAYQEGKVLRWATAGIGYLIETIRRKGYSRDLEDQADRLALWYMTRAGYDPREGLVFLERVEGLGNEVMTLGWFDSHRAVALRRRALLSELAHLSARRRGGFGDLARDGEEFQFFRTVLPSGRVSPSRVKLPAFPRTVPDS